MNILVAIIVGGLAGWIASMIMGRNAQQGIIMDIILGIVGGFLGGLIMSLFGAPGVTGFNLYSILVAIVGAIVLIAIGRAIGGGSVET